MPRAEKVKIRATDRDGKPFELEADGLLAICIQHEMDHPGRQTVYGLSVTAETTTYSSES